MPMRLRSASEISGWSRFFFIKSDQANCLSQPLRLFKLLKLLKLFYLSRALTWPAVPPHPLFFYLRYCQQLTTKSELSLLNHPLANRQHPIHRFQGDFTVECFRAALFNVCMDRFFHYFVRSHSFIKSNADYESFFPLQGHDLKGSSYPSDNVFSLCGVPDLRAG